ncbi:MAG TPA: hypothetical protein VM553_20740 [Dongiaceae bacterium]|nr:hypothetical protein [Dongiaceae bacterium]
MKMIRNSGVHWMLLLLAVWLGGCGGGTSTVEMKMNLAREGRSTDSPTLKTLTDGNFYHNGFPTDLRRQADGRIGIDDFPRRIHTLTNTYVVAIRDNLRMAGYHTIQPVYLPFTGALDTQRLPKADQDYAAANSAIQLVDVDPDSPEYGRRFPLHVTMTGSIDSYRPDNLLQLFPTLGVNLRPNTTYAAFVTNRAPMPVSSILKQHSQLAAALNGDTQLPADKLAIYAPLRDYLAKQSIAPATIMAATVWTTGEPTRRLRQSAEYVASLSQQPATELQRTKDFPDYCVIEGKVQVPGFQRGQAPYELLGGDVVWNAGGQPVQQYSRNAKFVVTIPKHGSMPAAGFPVLAFHHGAGGSAAQVYNRGPWAGGDPDEIPEGAAGGLGPSMIAAERGWASTGFAGHLSQDHLGVIFGYGQFPYNVFNPVALYNSYYQMVWERVYFRRAINRLTLNTSLCPDAEAASEVSAFRFDPNMQAVMGQSLGNWTASLQLAADPDGFEGAVLTGVAGTWMRLFANNEASKLALANGVFSLLPGETVDDAHPFLMLMEWLFGGADPVAHLDSVLRYPTKPAPHILAVSGINDEGTSEVGQRPHLMSLGLDLAGDDLGNTYDTTLMPHMAIAGARKLPYPVAGNIAVPGQDNHTGVVVRYADTVRPDKNGHHVAFDEEEPKHQYGCLLEQLAEGKTPVIGEGVKQGDPCW